MTAFFRTTVAALIASVALAAPARAEVADDRPEVVLWHAYRAKEADALAKVVQTLNRQATDVRIKVLAVPYDAFLDKITAAIPRGKGPDVFIAAHDSIGDWAEAGTISPLDDVVDPTLLDGFFDGLIPALLYKRTTPLAGEKKSETTDGGTSESPLVELPQEPSLYGLPLAFKSVALWRNASVVNTAPKTWSELVELAKANTSDGRYGLVYENRDLFYHVGLLHAFGGSLFDSRGRPTVDTDAFARSLALSADLANRHKVLPLEVSSTLVTSLFNQEKAAFIITGPWAYGDIEADKVNFAISPLPVVEKDAAGDALDKARAIQPFLTVESVMVSGKTEKRDLAVEVAKRLAAATSSEIRLTQGLQPVALKQAWTRLDGPVPEGMSKAEWKRQNAFLRAFRAQLPRTIPTPNTPAMKSMWGPTNLAMGAVLGQGLDAKEELKAAQAKLDAQLAEVAKGAGDVDTTGFQTFVALVVLLLLGLCVAGVIRYGPKRLVVDISKSGGAYAYVAPAMLGMGILVLLPFGFGVGMGFFKHVWGQYHFVGLRNFTSILLGQNSSFFFTLGMTVLWTAVNVFLHVSIGVVLALVLSQARLKYRTVYRVLFIIPWAVPNYITALIWKGMFHPEFGAVNAAFGIEGFSWMNQTWSAFVANVVTNTWLGFPFMMVTAMGGLTAIPKDLYEAAELDGANAWTRFTTITLPLLRPTLAPAIVLGTVWTFNMFNVIYLVSGGAPGGKTDILITEAFRWAFERGQGGAFGYAAAYSTLIFLMLLAYTISANRVAKAVSSGAT